jgi:hypothetical protein
VLRGLVGPHDRGKTYPNEMAGFHWLDDAWLADVLTYTRQDFGNNAAPVLPSDVARVRAATEGRTKPYTLEELHTAGAEPAPSARRGYKGGNSK